jgi:ATP-binding cassette subfamily C protein
MTVQLLPVAEPLEVRRAAWRLIRSQRAAFLLVLVTNCAAAATGLLGPWLVGLIVSQVQAGAGVAAIDRLGLLLLVAATAQLVIGRQASYLGYRFGERTAARLREQLTDRLMLLPARTVERAGTGDLTSRATTDTALVSFVLRDAAPEMVFALVQAVFIIVAVVVLSPLLALVALIPLLGIPLALRWYLRRARSAYLAQGAANAEVAEVLANTAAGARTVETLGLQDRRTTACSTAIEAATACLLRTLRLRTVFFPSIDISTSLAVGAVFGAGGLLYLDQHISLGTVVTAVLYLRQLSTPIDTILVWVETLQSSVASFARLEGLASEIRPARRGHASTPVDQHLVVTDVYYAYDDTDVLTGVSLDVQVGEQLAVVGPSGAGKTTLGRLIAGVDRPRAGTVTVGGASVADLPPEQLRQHVILVTQEHHVFADSLRDNLTIAAPHTSDNDLLAALHMVGADWVDELSDGLDTHLGVHRIGGAQAQHVALARVVLADPHTLVLDEATALLDPTSARHTERALAAAADGRTVVAVAHRLHTARDADRIAVMEDGRVTELGSHDELLATKASYAALWRAWAGGPPAVDTASPEWQQNTP